MPTEAPISPIDAIAAHHAEMVAELRQRVDDLLAVVALNEPVQPAAASVTDYLHSTVLPHAASEEVTLYAAATRFEPRLVQSLIAEHATLRRLLAKLAGGLEPVTSAATAGAIVELFATHAAKENDYLLPALLEAAPAELPTLMHSMHEEFEGRLRPRLVATLDVRSLPHASRHGQIFARLEALAEGEALTIINDHDPVPLRHQLDALWPGGFSWSYDLSGPQLWQVVITRQDGASLAPVAMSAIALAPSGNGATTAAVNHTASAGAVSGIVRLFGRSLRALGEAGRSEEANRLAAEAWALLRDTAPTEAARLSGLMHGLARGSTTSRDRRSPTSPNGDTASDIDIPELDVRSDPPAVRHQRIFDTFAGLAPGAAFILVNDHDPVPLRYQFSAEHPDEVEWQALEEGPEVWRVRIGRRREG